jgi:hypothetical protein
MGLETKCKVIHDGKTFECKAHLDDIALSLRADMKLTIPIAAMRSVTVKKTQLIIRHGRATTTLEIGKDAQNWADKIAHPVALIDKLGVKENQVVSILGYNDEDFSSALGQRNASVARGKLAKDSDFVFFAAETTDDLKRLDTLRDSIKRNGAIWIIWPKGRKELNESHIRVAAIAAELVDIKVARVSETLSGLKLVIPKAKR